MVPQLHKTVRVPGNLQSLYPNLTYYVVKFDSPLCVCFISFGFLLATICVWVWMVCSLHSVTKGSRDRANVPLIIIIITIIVLISNVSFIV